ncbi:hypothetical protein K9M79_07700 [Candidatus Woesearchaeota archaeon]|nr:hypothetical protein [Candidatus Woesearchaeota archaeon]
MVIPSLKKNVLSYLSKEDAKIAKENIQRIGSLIVSGVVCAVITSEIGLAANEDYYTHTNSDTCITQDNGVLAATHNHHSQHTVHNDGGGGGGGCSSISW